EKFGIVEVNPQGQAFNPEHHEAMATQPSAEAEPGTVLTVVQKGYLLDGRVLRPARVLVARKPEEDGAESAQSLGLNEWARPPTNATRRTKKSLLEACAYGALSRGSGPPRCRGTTSAS